MILARFQYLCGLGCWTVLTKIVSAIVSVEVKQLVKVPEDDRPADKDNLKKFESILIRYKNF